MSDRDVCPRCGAALSGIGSTGPGEFEAEPCGCDVSDARLGMTSVMTDGGFDIDLDEAIETGALDAGDDLEYLVALAIEADEDFEDSATAAQWVVAQWCQELRWVPDLTEYSTGRTVPTSADLEHLDSAFSESDEVEGVPSGGE
jgi:hypothetical protein